MKTTFLPSAIECSPPFGHLTYEILNISKFTFTHSGTLPCEGMQNRISYSLVVLVVVTSDVINGTFFKKYKTEYEPESVYVSQVLTGQELHLLPTEPPIILPADDDDDNNDDIQAIIRHQEREKEKEKQKQQKQQQQKQQQKQKQQQQGCNCQCPKHKIIHVSVPKTQIRFYPVKEKAEDDKDEATNVTPSPLNLDTDDNNKPFKPQYDGQLYRETGSSYNSRGGGDKRTSRRNGARENGNGNDHSDHTGRNGNANGNTDGDGSNLDYHIIGEDLSRDNGNSRSMNNGNDREGDDSNGNSNDHRGNQARPRYKSSYRTRRPDEDAKSGENQLNSHESTGQVTKQKASAPVTNLRGPQVTTIPVKHSTSSVDAGEAKNDFVSGKSAHEEPIELTTAISNGGTKRPFQGFNSNQFRGARSGKMTNGPSNYGTRNAAGPSRSLPQVPVSSGVNSRPNGYSRTGSEGESDSESSHEASHNRATSSYQNNDRESTSFRTSEDFTRDSGQNLNSNHMTYPSMESTSSPSRASGQESNLYPSPATVSPIGSFTSHDDTYESGNNGKHLTYPANLLSLQVIIENESKAPETNVTPVPAALTATTSSETASTSTSTTTTTTSTSTTTSTTTPKPRVDHGSEVPEKIEIHLPPKPDGEFEVAFLPYVQPGVQDDSTGHSEHGPEGGNDDGQVLELPPDQYHDTDDKSHKEVQSEVDKGKGDSEHGKVSHEENAGHIEYKDEKETHPGDHESPKVEIDQIYQVDDHHLEPVDHHKNTHTYSDHEEDGKNEKLLALLTPKHGHIEYESMPDEGDDHYPHQHHHHDQHHHQHDHDHHLDHSSHGYSDENHGPLYLSDLELSLQYSKMSNNGQSDEDELLMNPLDMDHLSAASKVKYSSKNKRDKSKKAGHNGARIYEPLASSGGSKYGQQRRQRAPNSQFNSSPHVIRKASPMYTASTLLSTSSRTKGGKVKSAITKNSNKENNSKNNYNNNNDNENTSKSNKDHFKLQSAKATQSNGQEKKAAPRT